MNQIDPKGKRYSSNGARTATLTGNQGVAARNAYLTCDPNPKWRKDRKYQRLFFLDEATALAFGHRPCNRCRRGRLKQFKAAWTKAGLGANTTGAMDDVIEPQRGRPHQAEASDLPNGTIVEVGNAFFTLVDGRMLQWSTGGYENPPVPLPTGPVTVLTPKSIVAAIQAGYEPELHPSAFTKS